MPSDSTTAADPLQLLLLALLPAVIAAILSAAHSACIYLEDASLRQLAQAGDKKARRILRLFEQPRRAELSVELACALLLAVSAAAVGAGLPPLIWRQGVPPEWLMWLCCLVWALLFLALGVAAPRRLAGYLSQDSALSLFFPLQLCCLVLTPLVFLIDCIGAVILRLCGKNPLEEPHRVTEEDIRMLVDEGEERGTIEVMEKRMINNIFEFDDRDVTEVMTHRTEVAAVEISAAVDEVVRVALETGFSRIPVYSGDIDNIRGFVYAKDLLKHLQDPSGFSLADELRTPLYVVESASCADVFALFQKEKTQIAVVVDEYGGTYGIVTMEDLLESIFGSIEDEFDNEQEMAVEVSDGVYILDGAMGISELERLLELRIPDDSDADTLGGFVTELLGGLPRRPDDSHSAVFRGICFTVIQSDEKRILKIRAVRTAEEDGE